MPLLRYYRAAWKYGIFSILKAVLSAMRDGTSVEMRIVDGLIKGIYERTKRMTQMISEERFQMVLSAEPNLYPLREMLREREEYYADKLRNYRFLVKDYDTPAIHIGRRGQDVVRELSLSTLEEGFLKGNPTVFTEKALADKIVKNGTLFKDGDDALKAMGEMRSDVINKIPLFAEDGRTKFMLHVQTKGKYEGKFRAMDVEKYADLVAFTTAGEADAKANQMQAKDMGTRLVKWNSTGKGVEFYESIGDDRCAAVDGQIASIEPEGTTINGVRYPYFKELLPGPYDTCHPYCRHRMAPYAEENLTLRGD